MNIMYKQQSRYTWWLETEGETSPFIERQEGVEERILALVSDTLKCESIQVPALPLWNWAHYLTSANLISPHLLEATNLGNCY